MLFDVNGVEYNTDVYEEYNMYDQSVVRNVMYKAYRSMRSIVSDNKCQGLKRMHVEKKINKDRTQVYKILSFTDEEINSIFIFIEKYFPRI
ncbi:hypothetical protein F1F76_05915 [Listeria monocytogenes]|uniref:Uncharacterized protein n=1 Tax=Listeria phage LP-030-2 TaxID=1173743 RepID=R4IDZ4_9CAUD|nr:MULTISPECIES: hypothetical protein [Listeria]YP_008126763.1 hypothetical protein LP030nr2_067 [Listeria phage LP-030-2]AFN40005.1 hypothetical protein LP030nr2_067 [Listeria phage LP-030-2]AVV12586.1 hypothetical protein CXL10_06875 [Listeria monocytogenes]AXO75354.1 hypothetical protein CYD36_05260 [Listeria monocytogenes]EAA0123983.1 hypothetical protein [Listeria monocytogenes]EAC2276727.1 hypothetical protein [Listeria monocytogenes]